MLYYKAMFVTVQEFNHIIHIHVPSCGSSSQTLQYIFQPFFYMLHICVPFMYLLISTHTHKSECVYSCSALHVSHSLHTCSDVHVYESRSTSVVYETIGDVVTSTGPGMSENVAYKITEKVLTTPNHVYDVVQN